MKGTFYLFQLLNAKIYLIIKLQDQSQLFYQLLSEVNKFKIGISPNFLKTFHFIYKSEINQEISCSITMN